MKILLIACILLLGACSSQNHYNWGGYSDGLYEYYHRPSEHAKVRQQLVAHIANLEKSAKLIPPGLYAEAGTFFLETGDSATAIEYYKKEYETWPESQTLMMAMIQNLEKRYSAD
ncbi:DUF4810 domain-containing protein [Teredinibacter haidensis]|uniref:DUF4810 domain-containing protein n=1 Tax=Teredinibacter haidensis TaxID=2731755 RepID=UPI0009491A86|nr:DUF4810 domain-containing protein [Teredinibacter haidensis]